MSLLHSRAREGDGDISLVAFWGIGTQRGQGDSKLPERGPYSRASKLAGLEGWKRCGCCNLARDSFRVVQTRWGK
jgi:hypothetical protein